MNMVDELFQRVVKTAEGAAMGTETSVSFEVMHGNYSLLPNTILQKLVHEKLTEAGGVTYSDAENSYAQEIYKTFMKPSLKIGSQEYIRPYKESHSYGSTDVGDVSWNVPTAGFRAATWVPGTASHSWQAVASGGTSIGLKGTEMAVKTLSATAIELFLQPELIKSAKLELAQRVGKDFTYEPLLGDRLPPLNYRK
jgi:aminobenzoyl-glutamate utilization protein B